VVELLRDPDDPTDGVVVEAKELLVATEEVPIKEVGDRE